MSTSLKVWIYKLHSSSSKRVIKRKSGFSANKVISITITQHHNSYHVTPSFTKIYSEKGLYMHISRNHVRFYAKKQYSPCSSAFPKKQGLTFFSLPSISNSLTTDICLVYCVIWHRRKKTRSLFSSSAWVNRQKV